VVALEDFDKGCDDLGDVVLDRGDVLSGVPRCHVGLELVVGFGVGVGDQAGDRGVDRLEGQDTISGSEQRRLPRPEILVD